MRTLRPALERGHANHGWLDTYHTFSFNTYYDENHVGFRALRVINDDRVQAGRGFEWHSHRDMEIITYVLEGALEHKDSMGNGSVIKPGDVQFMSAGSGVMHSEFNPSNEEPVHLLQIWIHPAGRGGTPGYAQKTWSTDEKLNRLCLIVSPDGHHGSLTIKQDARVYAAVLEKGAAIHIPLAAERHAWLHLAKGSLQLGQYRLNSGDGVAISSEDGIKLTGLDASEFLLFDLA
jgi:redox-sensitive bicupin YhaK (pirin superfamily)